MVLTRRGMIGAAVAVAAPSTGYCAGIAQERVAEVAPGIFVRAGMLGEATRGNLDGIANSGFIIGGDAVCVTDPGGSLADGQALRRALRRVTDRPITHVVLNHDHPDHVFGASAFVGDRPAFVGHAALPAALAIRGAYFRERLAAILGPAAGTVVTLTVTVRDTLAIDLGGRMLTLSAHPPAHTRCDVSLVDARTGILWAGDLVFCDRVPSLDGSLIGWLAALEGFAGARAVPGHGPAIVALAPAVAALRTYLTALRDGVRAAIRAGVPIDRAARIVAWDQAPHWRLFAAYHPGNVIQAYKELEWE